MSVDRALHSHCRREDAKALRQRTLRQEGRQTPTGLFSKSSGSGALGCLVGGETVQGSVV